MAAKKAKGGRPSKLDGLDRDQVSKLAKAGWTDAQMADFFQVTEQTWNNWKKKDPEFFESLKDWKAEADHDVERSLYERALGFTDPTGKKYAPDTTACIFWLKNRNPAQWRDKVDHGHEGPNGEPLGMNTVVILPAKDAGD